MDKVILNVDSEQIPTDTTNTNIWDFKYMRDADNNSSFNTINNVSEIAITNIKFHGSMNVLNTQITFKNSFLRNVDYLFLQINDYKELNNNSTSQNKYTCKLMFFPTGEYTGEVKAIPDVIKFKQPINIKDLHFRIFLKDGSVPTFNNAIYRQIFLTNPADAATRTNDDTGNLQGDDTDDAPYVVDGKFSFNLEITTLQNSILKSYNEMFTFSPQVLQNMAYIKMIKYYDNLSIENKKENDEKTNIQEAEIINSIAQPYSANMIDMYNMNEFVYDGNRIDYDYNDFTKRY